MAAQARADEAEAVTMAAKEQVLQTEAELLRVQALLDEQLLHARELESASLTSLDQVGRESSHMCSVAQLPTMSILTFQAHEGCQTDALKGVQQVLSFSKDLLALQIEVCCAFWIFFLRFVRKDAHSMTLTPGCDRTNNYQRTSHGDVRVSLLCRQS